jgi:hypothetical protein
MWYKTSAQGYIRYEDLANKMASKLFPIIQEIKKSPEYLDLTVLDRASKRARSDQQAEKTALFLQSNKRFENNINQRLTKLYNELRYMMLKTNLPLDFDIELRTGLPLSYSGGFEPNLLIFYIKKADDEKEFASTIEHELIHLHQFAYRNNLPFSDDEKQRLKKTFEDTNYYDLKIEGPAHIAEIMRELPSLESFYDRVVKDSASNPIYQMRGELAAKQDFLFDLLSNTESFITYLKHSDLFRKMFYGRESMQNPERRNKMLKSLYFAVRENAEKLLREL